jgi:hypothetical protein
MVDAESKVSHRFVSCVGKRFLEPLGMAVREEGGGDNDEGR